MRNLVVCCDGTWNTPDQKAGGLPAPTNVRRLFNALADHGDDGAEQKKYYHPGVGTEGRWWRRLVGGGVGEGLDANIKSAYQWLAYNYQPTDRIFLFGFSRGAYTVRSLSGMIGRCGLLAIKGLSPDEAWERIDLAFDCYRKRSLSAPFKACEFHNCAAHGDPASTTEIFFIGVWDTVGALGIPDDLALLNLMDDSREHTFHDTKLSGNVKHARHAVAIDERRQSFAPTLWTEVASHQDAKQIWFPGVHCDVGGGYLQTGLSDGALRWMIGEAALRGLKFQDVANQVHPDPWGVAHDSVTSFFKALKTKPRNVPALTGPPADFDESAIKRYAQRPIAQGTYWATKTLATDEQVTIDIFARDHWNITGLYLEQGASYALTASGQWLDRKVKHEPDGKTDGGFHFRNVIHMALSAWGKLETLYQTQTKNKQADFWWTKREEQYPWFSLIGVIANGVGATDEHPEVSTVIHIGKGCTIDIGSGESGYLYCFANDAWHAYGNNRGSVALTVKRTR